MIDREVVTGLLLDTESSLSLAELSHCCGVHAELIVEMVGEGILDPLDDDPLCRHFPGSSLPRANRALRLRWDLGINLAGVALVLELMDEIQHLRARLALLEPKE